jgi:ABC-type transport system involved in Fe-S cluster assembly, ATPase component
MSVVMVTHYQRLLEYIVPDVVHVMIDGVIVKTGGKELATRVGREGL